MRTNTGQILYIPKIGQRADFQHPLMKGCVGWWPLNDRGGDIAKDLSGNGNNGTVGSTVSWVTTDKGTNVNSDGANTTGSIGFGNPSELQITGDLTIAAWIRNDNAPPVASEYIVSKYNPIATQRAYGLALMATGIARFAYQSSGGPYDVNEDVESTATLAANEWHFVVGTFEASTAGKIYINGSLDTSNTTSVPASIHNSTADFLISGVYGATVTNCFDGDIQNVRVYNRALSPAEILELYTNPWAGLSIPSSTRYFFVPQLITASPKLFNIKGSSISMTSNTGRVSVRAAR